MMKYVFIDSDSCLYNIYYMHSTEIDYGTVHQYIKRLQKLLQSRYYFNSLKLCIFFISK